jgi:hypothetical protein
VLGDLHDPAPAAGRVVFRAGGVRVARLGEEERPEDGAGLEVAGANVGRAVQPTPANCDGVTTQCTYPAGTFGELSGNMTGLLATQTGDTTPFAMQFRAAPAFYVRGNPGPEAPAVRSLEHDVPGLTASNPYTGEPKQLITNYLASPAEEAILHLVNADPARTPTFTLFAKPDYFFTTGAANCNTPCVAVNPDFAYIHGTYTAELNTNFVALAGPGVRPLGLDGTAAADGPNSAGPDSGQVTVPDSGTTGSWPARTARSALRAWKAWGPATSSSTPASASSGPTP